MLMCAMIDLYLTERVLTYWCFSPGYSMLDLSSMMWPQCYTVVDLCLTEWVLYIMLNLETSSMMWP